MAKFKVTEVQRLVEDDFCAGPMPENPWHGIGPERAIDCLIQPPRSMRFVNFDSVGFVWLWAVFDERPGQPSGYLVVFDPRRGEYGLATKPSRGRHGTFLGLSNHRINSAIKNM